MKGMRYENSFAAVVHHVFTQYSLRAGEKIFGRKGVDAADKEMETLE